MDRNATSRKAIMDGRMSKKSVNVMQRWKGPMRIVANRRQIASNSMVVYLFSKPMANRLFICNRPASVQKLIDKKKLEGTYCIA